MSDRRRFECHRAAKGAFQQRDVRASLRRAVQQLRRVQPWPPAVVVRPVEAPVAKEVPLTRALKEDLRCE